MPCARPSCYLLELFSYQTIKNNGYNEQGLLTTASKSDGVYKYNFATVPLLAELIKLITSALLLSRQITADPKARTGLPTPFHSYVYRAHV